MLAAYAARSVFTGSIRIRSRLVMIETVKRSTRLLVVSTMWVALMLTTHAAGGLEHSRLRTEFQRIAQGVDGRVGVCARDASGTTCVNGDRRFSLQSVMKLLVGIAVLDAVDRAGWQLDGTVVVRRQDLSVFVQPIADLVTDDGYRTTIGDLVRRAIIDSDSAATDLLIARLGGPAAVQRVLDRLRLRGVRLDRDERHLQTEIVGLTWRPEYVDPAVLERAIAAVPEARRDTAWRKYSDDRRDTATPEGMADLLYRLADKQLLSRSSTDWLLATLEETVTFPNRLKAGVPPGWRLGHKTGTSGSWRGVTAAVNDVGVLTAPDGTRIAIAAFIADTRAPGADRGTPMALLARATVTNYRVEATRGEARAADPRAWREPPESHRR